MLGAGYFFLRSTDHKQRVKKQNIEIEGAVTTGDQGKRAYFMYLPWSPIYATLSIFNVSLSC